MAASTVDQTPVGIDELRLTELLADSYRAAALSGTDMRAAAEAIESIRSCRAAPGSRFRMLDALSDRVGELLEDALGPILIELRTRLREEMQNVVLAEVRSAFTASAQEGWTAWLQTYSEALFSSQLGVCAALAAAEFELPATAPPAAHLQTMTRLVADDRWAEVLEFVVWLSDQEPVATEYRTRFRVWAAQIELYHLSRLPQALDHLDEAERLTPDDASAVAGRGEYHLQRQEYGESREFLQRAISLAPALSDGYLLMGDSYEHDDPSAAEEWYREAIRQKPGESQGYLRLVRLIGRPELLASREAELLPLFETAVAVDPPCEYNACLEVGSAYKLGKRFDDAQAWYDRAVLLDPSRLGAKTSKGYAYLEAGDSERAREAFDAAIAIAPEAFDGYWGMAFTAESEDEDSALPWYEKSLSLRPAWEGIVRSRIGDLHLRAGRYVEAEAEFLAALRLDPKDDSFLGNVANLVGACFEANSSLPVDDARRFLEQAREIAGDSYEATYRNLLGNLSYFVDDYEPAIEAYERAVELAPDEPVYLSNLAGAWELLRRPGRRDDELAQSIAALERAAKLDPTSSEYPTKLSELLAEQTVVRMSGEQALERLWVLPLIRVDVTFDLRPLVLDEDESDLSPALTDLIAHVRESIWTSHGVPVPGIQFRDLSDAGAPPCTYVIRVREAAQPPETMQADKRFFRGPLEPLTAAGIPVNLYRQALAGAWVAADHWEAATQAGLQLLTPLEYMLSHVESVLRDNLERFVDHQAVALLLEDVEQGPEFLASDELLGSLVTALRALVGEQLPINSLEAVCRALIATSGSEVDRVESVERLRALPELAAHLRPREGSTIYRVGPVLQADLERGLIDAGGEDVVALPREDEQRARVAFREGIRGSDRPALVVENPKVRPFLRALVASQFPDAQVFSSGELPPDDVARAESIDVTGAA